MNNSRSKCFLLLFLMALITPLSTAYANDLTVFDEVYFPVIKDGPHAATGPYADGLWANYVSVLSANTAVPANIMYILYNDEGGWEHLSSNRTPVDGRLTVTPNWLMHEASDAEAFHGTVVIAADRPIVAMVNQLEPSGEAFMIYESPRVRGGTLVFPQAFDNYVAGTGFQRILRVQNLNETPVDITITYADDWMGTVIDQYTIPVGGEYKRNVRDVTGNLYSWENTNFNGTIVVSINHCAAEVSKIAGVLYSEYILDNTLKSSTIYGGTTARTELSFPYIHNGFGDSANWYSIYNPSDDQVSCRVEFYPVEGDTGSDPVCIDGQVAGDEVVLIEPGERHSSTPSWACYGDHEHDFDGSMVAKCSGPVHSVINAVTWDAAGNAERYNQHESVTRRNVLLFPKIYDSVSGYANTAHIQNPNAFPITIDLELFYSVGEPLLLGTDTKTIGPYGKYVFRPYTMNETAKLTNGHLEITVRDGHQAAGVLVFEKPQFISIYEAATPMQD